MQALRSHEQIRDVNTRYHDVAAASYDEKWGIDFGDTGRGQVLGKIRKLLGSELDRGFASTLEIGAGTGYFSLNLLAAGVIDELTCTDISAGMLDVLQDNAQRLGLGQVNTVQADAESLPFRDQSFDLVLGHAVLHHLPDLDRAFAEFHRVLRPGGRILFAGEPSFLGDRIARAPKRAALLVAPLWRRALHAQRAATHAEDQANATEHELEGEVDIHAFAPADLERLAAAAGFSDVSVRGEELVANWFGWFNRGLEATAVPDDVPMWWRRYAFHGYLGLQRLDRRALEPRLPAAIFYNLLLTARTPTSAEAMSDRLANGFPLFPLQLVVLPSEIVPLHIFEERFKTMIEECLSGDNEFGIVWMADDGLHDIGCACRVERVLERFDDGRLNLLARGTRPLRIIERQRDLAYPAGVVEFLVDDPGSPRQELIDAARAAYGELVHKATDRTPTAEELETMDAYAMAATVDFGLEAKQGLLGLRSEEARLRLVARLFRAALKRLDFVDRAQARAKSNGKVRFG